ncbi:MAG: 3'(2'),5'-bisphosphate nucleotidase CysQ [Microthrixaceae bacterium]|nr:3'(2'),5'-bisphosphate nucleotidase CysQ [Microthrixaceae bacterium]
MSGSPDRTDPDDHHVARQLATEAGTLLIQLRDQLTASGATPADLKAEGDRRANTWIMERLAELRPDDPVLSEEERERPDTIAKRLASSRAWIVDPLDGTREFSETPRTDWAVHVALCIDGEPVVGAVALPALGVTLSTAEPPPLPTPAAGGAPRVVVSRSRPPAQAVRIADELGGTLVPMGSAGAKAMAVVRGEADLYPHSGGQYEWDSCAPVAVALAAGLWCSRLDGSPLRYNNADPYLPDLLICRPEYAADAIRAARNGHG